MDYVSDTVRRVNYDDYMENQSATYEYGINDKTFQLEVEYGPGTDHTNARIRGMRREYNGSLREKIEYFDDGVGESFTYFQQHDTNRNVTKLEIAYVDSNNTSTNRSLVHESVYDLGINLPVRITDAAGNKVEIDYTNASPSVIRAFYSGTESYDTLFSYTTNGLLAAVQNANSNVTQFAYDSRGFLATVTPPIGPASRTVHNEFGFLTESEIVPEGSTNGTGRVTTYTRNAAGRMEAVQFADGLGMTNQYNAMDKVTRITDRAGRHTDFDYVLGQDVVTVRPGAGRTRLLPDLASVSRYLDAPGGTSQPVRITYDYDKQFNALRITEPRGRYVESYQLDIQGRVTSVTNINDQVMSISYGLGNLFGGHGDFVKGVTRFDGSTVSNRFDNAGRRIATTLSDGQNSRTLSTTYKANSLIASLSDGTTSFTYDYDRLNRLTSISTTLTNSTISTAAYAFDPVGSLTNTVVEIGSASAQPPEPSAFSRSFEYDAANRLTSLSQSGTGVPPVVFAFSFASENGAVSRIANLDTGISAKYAYDVMNRHTEIKWVDAATNTLRGFEMAYDSASMITNITHEVGQYRVYGYDSIDRLVSEQQYNATNGLTYSAAYEYDLAGNRTQTVINGITNIYTLATGDQLSSWGVSGENTLTYDNAGNVTQIALTGKPALNLAWDIQYRLTSASTNGTPVESYQYDASGRRIATTSGTNVVRHVYDGMHVIADTDDSGNLLRSYVWGPGIDNLLSMTVHPISTNSTASTFNALTDHLGTVHAFVDENGDTVEFYKYDAWGNILGVYDSNGDPLTSDLGLPTSALGNRFLFQGREYSFSTGLYNFRARWYDPLTGRWLSNDPIGIGGGLNQYVAFGNNPVMFVDPWGNAPLLDTPDNRETAKGNALDDARTNSLNKIDGPPEVIGRFVYIPKITPEWVVPVYVVDGHVDYGLARTSRREGEITLALIKKMIDSLPPGAELIYIAHSHPIDEKLSCRDLELIDLIYRHYGWKVGVGAISTITGAVDSYP
ncbi:MAG: RHS repeat-associated core domain-containing protein [Kiritimatiellia bacterium]|nr:RHS repeat-associated core domain-containing protein [Kiritimatiellia bacterium]